MTTPRSFADSRGRRSFLVEYERRVRRDAAAARRRSLARKLGGPLVKKYVRVVPSVFGATGELAGFRLLIPSQEALARLRSSAVLTLDSATELLGGFRFGTADTSFVYLMGSRELEKIAGEGIGIRLGGSRFPLSWAPPGQPMLFAVVPPRMPPCIEKDGFRVVEPAFLVRELLGFHGLRLDLIARIESRITVPYGLDRLDRGMTDDDCRRQATSPAAPRPTGNATQA